MGAYRNGYSPSPRIVALRLLAATAAGVGLCLHLLNLGFFGWLWSAGTAEALAVDPRLLAPTTIRVLAWGVGFSVLALVIVLRIGDRFGPLMAALFLACYSVWGGIMEAIPLRGEAWWPAAFMVFDGLTHATGVRFTQVFPRRLRGGELLELGPRWIRRTVMPGVARLLDPRIFWPAAVVVEGGIRLLPPSPGLFGAHVLFWVTLAATYLYAGYRSGDLGDRRRLFWILEGVVVFVAAQVVFMGFWALGASGVAELDLEVWGRWLWAITSWITLTCFYLAVFHSGAFDSGLVLRRTTVLSASSAAAVLIFIVLETLIQELIAELFGVRSRVGSIVAGIVAGLTFHPISVRIDRRLQRLFTRTHRPGLRGPLR